MIHQDIKRIIRIVLFDKFRQLIVAFSRKTGGKFTILNPAIHDMIPADRQSGQIQDFLFVVAGQDLQLFRTARRVLPLVDGCNDKRGVFNIQIADFLIQFDKISAAVILLEILEENAQNVFAEHVGSAIVPDAVFVYVNVASIHI